MNVETAGFTTEALFSLPPGCIPDAVTSDGHVVAFWPQPDGRLRFVWDGVAGEPFDGLMEMRDKSSAVFSSDDGAHVAYVGTRGDRTFVGRDGGEDPSVSVFSRSVPPVFSPGGIHLAYGASQSGDDVRLVLDGRVIGELPIAPIAAVFSPDGERLAYAEIRTLAKGSHECRIVLDGIAGEWFDGIRNAVGAMQFSPDSHRFAHFRVDGKGHCQWVVDGVAQRLANEVPTVSLARLRRIGAMEPPLAACFSPDSRRFAYFADVFEKGVAIIEDDVAGPLFKGVGMPVFSPDSRHMAYLAQTHAKTLTLVLDGTPGPEWSGSWGPSPTFSADSRRVAVTLAREDGNFLRRRHLVALAVDGHILTEVPGDDASMELAFSPDGERVAWWVRRGEITEVMVNESPHTGAAIAHSEPVFTRTGRLVYGAIMVPDGQVTIMVDGRPGPLADVLSNPQRTIGLRGDRSTLPFAISPDGEHVAWAGSFGDECRPVIDDRVGPPFDQVVSWAFGQAETVFWYAQRGDIVYRVTA